MEHELYFDGTITEYSWSIKTENKIINQIREHPPAYLSGGKLDVKDDQQSRFIALHVGIYWGLGVFIIKDNDIVNVMCDSVEIRDLMTQNRKVDDQIISDKIYFINQLTEHRNLKINYEIIKSESNLATELLSTNGKKSASRDSRGFV
ncbi:MAG: hypothetical protein QF559_01560 [Candidatus Nitrosopelagicus sp.]|jgi:hypothetical protein|nr:hypothetical protein [Candidatus Nitrosopelagicus sp.]